MIYLSILVAVFLLGLDFSGSSGYHSYGAPAPIYGAPAPTYGAPAPTYGAPAPTYGAPAPSYNSRRFVSLSIINKHLIS